ncbi:hypothetical protein INT48_001444 [Thamnidium elegans]|uniref:WW domain-containing protein n=1 Tax=Thamnidium elegans TaxID=101142 RepID=A0A8H7SP18_9FUNG|nr:hypothetical protein INT48_001444 [Thamnidium elegans]
MPVPVPLKRSTNVGDEQINPSDTVNASNASNTSQNTTRSRLPQHWRVKVSDIGSFYYYNEITGEERETRPT